MNINNKLLYNKTATVLITFILTSGIVLTGCNQNTATGSQPEGVATELSSEQPIDSSSDEQVTKELSESVTGETATDEFSDSASSEASSVFEEETTTTLNYAELIDFDSELPYMIRINRAQNWAMIYGLDKNGRYSVPYKIFLCSTGLNKGDTPVGSFTLGQKYDWRLMVDGSYAQYAIRIHGQIMLHSVPYYSQNKNDLEVEEYAKLGSPASLGCIRFNVESIKWIYDNCPDGTVVVIYDSEEEIPLLELPQNKKAKAKGSKAGWDPTDPDKNNPWKKKGG